MWSDGKCFILKHFIYSDANLRRIRICHLFQLGQIALCPDLGDERQESLSNVVQPTPIEISIAQKIQNTSTQHSQGAISNFTSTSNLSEADRAQARLDGE